MNSHGSGLIFVYQGKILRRLGGTGLEPVIDFSQPTDSIFCQNLVLLMFVSCLKYLEIPDFTGPD